jgi:hypothetical protein
MISTGGGNKRKMRKTNGNGSTPVIMNPVFIFVGEFIKQVIVQPVQLNEQIRFPVKFPGHKIGMGKDNNMFAQVFYRLHGFQ